MDGESNGAQAQGEGQQGNQADGQQQQAQQPAAKVGAGAVDGSGVGEGAGNGAAGDGNANGNDGSGDAAGEVAEVVAKADAEYRAALAERDKKIAELEAQVAEAFKSTEAAEGLAKQIEEMKAAADAERTGFELKLAGCRSVRAGRVLLAEHDGDMAALKKAEPWLFDAAPGGGATGLEPAGASSGEGDEMKRWMDIAGLE